MRMRLLLGNVEALAGEIQVVDVCQPDPRRSTLRRNALARQLVPLSLLVMLLLRRVLTPKQIWIASVVGGICHNIGQILVAMAVTSTPSIAVYLPVLILSGLAAGLFTGLCAQYLIDHMKRIL